MIIPFYYKIESVATYGKKLLGKWWVVYHKEYRGMKFSRYLHPTGWKKISHYFDTFEEAVLTFNRIGQMDVSVTEREYNDEIVNRRDFQEMLDQEY